MGDTEGKFGVTGDLPLPRYMIASKATHKMGDLSRDGLTTDSICFVERWEPCEHDRCGHGNYVGAWVTGFGFYEVRFDHRGMRELTPEEYAEMDGKVYALAGNVFPGSEGERIRKANGAEDV